MTNVRRLGNRFRSEARYCTQMAATPDDSPDVVEEAKQRTHDICIKVAGEHRRSGVSWRILAANHAHREIHAAVRTHTQLMDRHDPGVIELPGDLRLLEESRERLVVDVVAGRCRRP